jgi:TRAP-type C4-dicarboxylate transport system permease small subunit
MYVCRSIHKHLYAFSLPARIYDMVFPAGAPVLPTGTRHVQIKENMNTSPLPIKRGLARSYTFSIISGILMTVMSLAGIVFQSALYSPDELRQSFVTNDILNLAIGLPVVLGSVWFARHGKWIGLLLLPGTLFYIVYNYIAYSVAMSQTFLLLPGLCLVAVSGYAIFLTLSSMDMNSIQTMFQDKVPARFAGGVLITFGALFFVRSISQLAGLLTGQLTLEGAEFGVLVSPYGRVIRYFCIEIAT